MLSLLLILVSFSAGSLALGSLIGSAIHYGGAWDALEAEWQAGDFTRTVTVTVREPRLVPGGELVRLPGFNPLADQSAGGLRAAA